MTDINIKIKNLDGVVYSLTIPSDLPVSELRERTHVLSGIPIQQVRLISRGKVLKDDKDIKFYNIEEGNTIHLVERPPDSTSSDSTQSTTANTNSPNTTTNTNTNSRIFINGVPSPTNDINSTIQNVLRGLAGPNTVVMGTSVPSNPHAAHQNMRTLFNSVSNPTPQPAPGQPAPTPASTQPNPEDESRNVSEKIAESLRASRGALQWLTEQTDQAISQLDNERNMTDPAERQRLQQQIRNLQAAYMRTSMATNSMGQYLGGYQTGAGPNQSTHAFPQPTAQVSQISVQIPMPGQPGAPGTQQPNPQGIPGINIGNPNDIPNVIQNVLGSIMSGFQQPAQPQQAGQSGQPQQQVNNPLQQILQGITRNFPLAQPQATGQSQPQQPQQPRQSQPQTPSLNQFESLIQMLGTSAAANQSGDSQDPMSNFLNALPTILVDFRYLHSDVPSQMADGHRNIRNYFVNDLLNNNTSEESIETFIDGFVNGVNPYLRNIPPEMQSRIIPGADLVGRVTTVIRNSIRSLLRIILTEPSETYHVPTYTSEWTSNTIYEIITELGNCLQGGTEDAFAVLNRFFNELLVSFSPIFAAFLPAMIGYMRRNYEQTALQRGNRNSNPTSNAPQTTTPTTTTTTTTSTSTSNLPFVTTPFSNVNRTSSSNNGGDIVPPEWMETIERDTIRQQQEPASPMSQLYKNPSSIKKKQKTSSNTSQNSLFAERLQQSTTDVSDVNAQDLLIGAENQGLVEMYDKLIKSIQQDNNDQMKE